MFEHGSLGDKFYIIIQGTVSVIVPIPVDDQINMVSVAQLSSGMAFGELALMKNQPRAASIKCLTDCHLAVLSKPDYMKVIGKAEAKLLDRKIQFLKETPFFAKWSKRQLEKVSYYFNYKKYTRNQVVFTQGSRPLFVYLIRSGEFELNKPLLLDNSKETKYNIKVALLGKGEMIGEDEVISGQNYKNTCVCYSGIGEILMISAQNFIIKFYQKPESQEVVKRKLKIMIREERVKKFQVFLNSSHTDQEQEGKSQTIRKNMTSKARKLSETVKHSFSPLNHKQIEEIKRKALGFGKKEKVYIVFNSPLSSMNTEENERSPTSIVNSSRSRLEMRVHQPGGYYRSKLKKPRNLSLDIKISYTK